MIMEWKNIRKNMVLEDDTKMWLHGRICLLHILKLAMINNMAANRIYFFGSLLSWVRTPPGLEKFRSSVGRAQI